MQKIALLGPNGAGKTTFLKTIAGFLPSLEGSYSLGNQTTIGYFDQHSGAIQSEQTVLEHFTAQFPALTEKEARSILGAYLFGGRDAQKKVSSLSGGEKACPEPRHIRVYLLHSSAPLPGNFSASNPVHIIFLSS